MSQGAIVHRQNLADARLVPWANGRGVTRELVRRAAPGGRLLLRLSVADVVEPGPFSPLPGIDRILTLIEGPGFDLSLDGQAVPVRLLAPLAFAGEAAAAATAVPGPSRDFNVMVDRAFGGAAVTVHRARFEADDATRFLFVVDGRFGMAGATCDAGDLIEIGLPLGATMRIDGEGALLAVALRPR